MPTAKEYRQRAEECLELANSARELYVRIALAELAQEFSASADDLEARMASYTEVAPRRSEARAHSRWADPHHSRQRSRH
jgi:hypothetical protein